MTGGYPMPPYCTKGSTLCMPVSTLLFSRNYILSTHAHTSCVHVILIYRVSFHSCMVFYLGSMQRRRFNQCPIHGHFSRFQVLPSQIVLQRRYTCMWHCIFPPAYFCRAILDVGLLGQRRSLLDIARCSSTVLSRLCISPATCENPSVLTALPVARRQTFGFLLIR